LEGRPFWWSIRARLSDGNINQFTDMSLREELFGKMADGREIKRFTMKNQAGLTVRLINYGGIVSEILTSDRHGHFGNVVLGFDNLEAYLKPHPFFGATTGRVANRIGDARFSLDGKTCNLDPNNGKNHLHGGRIGFDKVVWEVAEVEAGEDASAVQLRYLSPDGDQGYPGNLEVRVFFRLNDLNEVCIEYRATTDQATPVNLTNHSYFNLAGRGTILEHLVQSPAEYFTPVNDELIPTGEILSVRGTPLDFLNPCSIGARIEQLQPKLGGYDHNLVLGSEPSLKFAVSVFDPASGRRMEVQTTEPAFQLYTGNFLDGSLVGAGGAIYERHGGLCLETQHYPDSPNKPHFPSVILRPGGVFNSSTIYKFNVVSGNEE